jgi:hypothetical protein
MRFFDHGGAADFYKQVNCRGICVKMVSEFLAGRVGVLITGAQRAESENGGGKRRSGKLPL